ncbi:hypothetical protein C1H69_15830 [Billgrantia endophytica]|uniref:Uncharacterized protein n=1 Tax=Billgrantia endophytica TaxID=2033802 RepID=A0A2N7U0G8_9GAMM|nr:hypothetical protein C1H69_15830 [Halomonas endophytica]
MSWRILLCHKHPVSARLHFLVPLRAGVVLPQPLPELSVFAEARSSDLVQAHPASALRHLQECLGIGHTLELVSEFQVGMEVPGMTLPVYLAALPGHDLCPAPTDTRWIELSKSIGMPWLDRELLRRAYEVLIG